MPVEIRAGSVEDADAIAEVHVKSWQTTYRGIMPELFLQELSVEDRSSMWKKSLRAGEPEMLVAYADEAMVGWIAFGACRDADKESTWAEVEALYVLPEFWGRGIGRRLSNSALQLLRSAGYSFVALWVLSENHDARAFCNRIGFAHDHSIKDISVGGASLTEMRYHRSLTS